MSLSYNNSVLAQTINVSGSNNTSVTGVLTATSGNFTNALQLNRIDVSVSGHTHTTNNILDFETAIQNIIIHPFLLGGL